MKLTILAINFNNNLFLNPKPLLGSNGFQYINLPNQPFDEDAAWRTARMMRLLVNNKLCEIVFDAPYLDAVDTAMDIIVGLLDELLEIKVIDVEYLYYCDDVSLYTDENGNITHWVH